MTRFSITVDAALKGRVIARARSEGRSLATEVALTLLERYRPPGWRDLELDVRRRNRLTNARATVLGDGAPEELCLYLPPGLLTAVRKRAARNFRSARAEIVATLTRRYR